MSELKKALIAISFFVLAFSLFNISIIYLRGHTEQEKIEELTKVWEDASNKGAGEIPPLL